MTPDQTRGIEVRMGATCNSDNDNNNVDAIFGTPSMF